jgi:hypothetical protein
VIITPENLREPRAGDTVFATGGTGTSGSITTDVAHTNLTNALIRLPGALLSPELQLQPQCDTSAAFSSFLLNGKGGLSFDPATWSLEFQFMDQP